MGDEDPHPPGDDAPTAPHKAPAPCALVAFNYTITVLESLAAAAILVYRFVYMVDNDCFFSVGGGNWTNFKASAEICDAGIWAQIIFAGVLGWAFQLAACTFLGVYIKSHIFLYGMAGLGVFQLGAFLVVMALEFAFEVPFMPYIVLSFVFIGLTLLLVIGAVALGRVVPRPKPVRREAPSEEQQLLDGREQGSPAGPPERGADFPDTPVDGGGGGLPCES